MDTELCNLYLIGAAVHMSSANIYDRIGIPSRKNHRKINKLTEPLATYFGIDRFWRSAHRLDGTYSLIGNHPPTAELFFGHNLYMEHPFFRHPLFFQSGCVIPELFHNQEYSQTQGRFCSEGNCYHVFIKIQRTLGGFVEYGFASSKYVTGFESTYLYRLAAINKYVEYFEDSAANLIKDADDYRIDISNLIGAKYDENPRLEYNFGIHRDDFRFLCAISGDGNKVEELLNLSETEKSCLKLYMSGKTAKEIGKKIFRSNRTVEKYLETTKTKLGLSTRSQLIEFLMPFKDFF